MRLFVVHFSRIHLLVAVLLMLTAPLSVVTLAQSQPHPLWLAWVGNGAISLWNGIEVVPLTANSDGALARNPTWSSDGWLAWESTSDEGTNIEVWDGQTITDVSQNDAVDSDARWSPGGQLAWIAHQTDKEIVYVWDRSAGIVLSEESGSTSYPYPGDHLFWSPDGRLAWETSPDQDHPSQLRVWDGETIINVSDTLYSNGCTPAWSPQGLLAWFINCGAEGSTNRVAVWNGTTVTQFDPHYWSAFASLWSPDGRLTWMSNFRYYENSAHDVYVWDGDTPLLATGDMGAFEPLSWSPDGRRLAWATDTAPGQRDIYTWDGQTITSVTQDAAFDFDPLWLDNTRLVFHATHEGQDDLFLWDGQHSTPLTDTPDQEWDVQVAPDGRLAWLSGEQGSYITPMDVVAIEVWDGDLTHVPARAADVSRYEVTGLAWSPFMP